MPVEHGAEALTQLFALLVATKIGEAVLVRLGQPGVIGEMLGGVVVGSAALNLGIPSDETRLFAEIGVVLLMFRVGLETEVDELVRVGRHAALVGTFGIALPFAGGLGLALALDLSLATAVFLAAALVATSTGITTRVLMDLGVLTTRSARVILGAAIIDDILAMLVLALAAGIAAGRVRADELIALVLVALGFVGAVLLGGRGVLRRRRSLLALPMLSGMAEPIFRGSPLLPGMILMLCLAALAAVIGLAAIIGALLAGMILAEASERPAIEAETAPMTAFFAPFFFGSIGASMDIRALAEPSALGLVALILAVAIVTKFAGAFLAALPLGAARATLIGWGMVPRGEVGIIVASYGLQRGAIDQLFYSVVVVVTVLTTLIVPPLLPSLIRRAEREALGDAVSEESEETELSN